MHDRPTQRGDPDFTIAGIGASAGGVNALKTFFELVPDACGLAFVVVVHLPRTSDSHLEEILQRHASLPVLTVKEPVRLAPNRIYVIPPGMNLDATGPHLRPSALQDRERRFPIDHFFRGLAAAHERRAVGVVLTGTGSDGALGIGAIRAHGGFTIAQAPDDAEHAEMPGRALASGEVDLTLPLDQIPPALLGLARATSRARAIDEQGLGAATQRELLDILQLLRDRTGRDFSYYRPASLLRRIDRRMQLEGVEGLSGYLEHLARTPKEQDRLRDDLLVTVTSFFRDPKVYEKLTQLVIPELFAGRVPTDEVRVWSIGCATGEEAYSLAILLLEEAARHAEPARVQVFGTDVNGGALEHARHGHYAANARMDVSPERLDRFFDRADGGYRVRSELREVVVFAHHDAIVDPPFHRIDLIACRNLMIYLEPKTRSDLLRRLSYALREGGRLLAGTSETVERSGPFRPVDTSLGIYQKRAVDTAGSRLPVRSVVRAEQAANRRRAFWPSESSGVGAAAAALHWRLMELYAPPSVLVDPDNEVVHLSERAGQFMVPPGGAPTANVLRLVRPELSADLRVQLDVARRRKAPSRSRAVSVRFDGGTRTIVLEVRPALDAEQEDFALVLFETRPSPASVPVSDADAGEASEPTEADLLRRRLDELAVEYERTQDQMRASNEEMLSVNEELRAALQELETGKEELESINQELQTANQENRHKVDELDRLSSDLQNFLNATSIATVFLDRELRITRFTPAFGGLFNVKPIDRGRPLSDITHRLGQGDLVDEATAVLANLVPVERELQDDAGRWHLTRVRPYRSALDRIGGVVITLVDITDRKRSEEDAETARHYAEKIIETLPEPLLVLTPELTVKSTNSAFLQLFEVQAEDTIGRRVYDLGNGQWDIPSLRRLLEEVLPDNEVFMGYEVDHVFEGLGRRVMLLNGRRLDHLQLILLGLRDITEQKTAEEALHASDRRKDEFVAMVSHELRDPLGALRNGLSLMMRSLDDRTAVDRSLVMMNRQLDQLTHLVDDLLDVNRVGEGRLVLRLKRTSLGAALEQALETVRPWAGRRKVEHAAPPAPIFVWADPTRLAQIFGNLLSNAIKFTRPDGHIRVEVAVEGADVVVSVADDGVGIPAESLGATFALFWQGEASQADSPSGLGVGLALARRLVELHEGTIEAHSDGPGKGSTFIVRLPRLDEAAPPAAPEAEASPPKPASGLTILVVDDNADATESLAALLGQAGNRVTVADTGEAALRAVDEASPDVVLLDIGLPDIDGFEVARRIRSKENGDHRVVIVALSGWGGDSTRQRSSQAGIDHHLTKPLDLATLWRILSRSHE